MLSAHVGGPLRTGWRWLTAVLLAAVLVIAAPGVLANAQTRIGINGGRPSEWPILAEVLASQGLTQDAWFSFASQIGENWLPGTRPVPLDYPGQLGLVSGPSALTVDQSTEVGQQLLHALILSELAKGESVAVAGLSEGTLVIDRELAYLATLSEADAPSRDALTFYVFGDMLRGLGQMYLRGVTIPFVGQTFGAVPETKYDTVVVNEQWDGWANPPDRPWNLLAVLNSVMGALLTINGSNDHSLTSLDRLSDAIKVSETTNTLGGTTTTYLVPRQQLPLTKPLRQLGFPDWVVDEIDKLLMPLIQAGYSTLTPNLGPHIERGQFVWTSPVPPTAVLTSTAEKIDVASAALVPVGAVASPNELATSTSDAASSARQGATADARSSVEPQSDEQPNDAVDPGQVLGDDQENVATADPSTVDAPAETGSAADVGQPGGAPDDAVAAAGPVNDDSKAVVTHRVRPTRAGGPDDSDGSSDLDRPDRQAAGAAEAGGSLKDDPKPVPADSHGSADAQSEAKSSSAAS